MLSFLLRVFAAPLHVLYGLYAMTVFLVFAFPVFMIVLLPLRVNTRRRAAHYLARSFFVAAGMRMRIHGLAHLPAGPCVIVANHASYLDGVVLKAALPARFSFVIKKEVSRVPIAGLLLRRIGSEFVDRFNRHAGGLDARRLLKAADSGQSLAFFPEGTFHPYPGVGKFHNGAFAIALRAALPVAPVAIRGTRWILPSGRLLPRPGAIDIHVLPSLPPSATPDAASALPALRDQARSRIVAVLGEPDLVDHDGLAALQARRT